VAPLRLPLNEVLYRGLDSDVPGARTRVKPNVEGRFSNSTYFRFGSPAGLFRGIEKTSAQCPSLPDSRSQYPCGVRRIGLPRSLIFLALWGNIFSVASCWPKSGSIKKIEKQRAADF
jgi:hypothetical protein